MSNKTHKETIQPYHMGEALVTKLLEDNAEAFIKLLISVNKAYDFLGKITNDIAFHTMINPENIKHSGTDYLFDSEHTFDIVLTYNQSFIPIEVKLGKNATKLTKFSINSGCKKINGSMLSIISEQNEYVAKLKVRIENNNFEYDFQLPAILIKRKSVDWDFKKTTVDFEDLISWVCENCGRIRTTPNCSAYSFCKLNNSIKSIMPNDPVITWGLLK